jgi:uncharacterized LabA/DUF88 family protein
MSNFRRMELFNDGPNLYMTAKAMGFDIDFRRLLKEFQSRATIVRALYYSPIIEDQEYSSIRPLIDWLDYNGYVPEGKEPRSTAQPTAEKTGRAVCTRKVERLQKRERTAENIAAC